MHIRESTRRSRESGPGDFRIDLAKMYAIKLSRPNPGRGEKALFWLFNSEFHVVACYRYGRFADRVHLKHPLLGIAALASHRFWNRWITHIDHFEIHPHSRIGPGLLVMHRHGIILNAEIGQNCVIHQNVTIGQHAAGGDQRAPRIGNGVWIGPGAIVTGPIVIGDGATISAGTVLTKDIPPRCLVAGNPGRVIAQDYDNAALINFVMPDSASFP